MKSLEYNLEIHQVSSFKIEIPDEKAFRKELSEWLKQNGSVHISNLLDEFSSIEIYEMGDPNDDANREFEYQQQCEELYELFKDELGIDVKEMLSEE